MHSGAYREIFYTAEVSRQPENVSENGHTGKFDTRLFIFFSPVPYSVQ